MSDVKAIHRGDMKISFPADDKTLQAIAKYCGIDVQTLVTVAADTATKRKKERG